MDPNETFRQWFRLASMNEMENASEYWRYLQAWLAGGGFAPTAFNNPIMKKEFLNFKPTKEPK